MVKCLLKSVFILAFVCGVYGVLCGDWLGGVEAYASSIQLPKTGQTTCYNSASNVYGVVACTGSGQDGDILAGKSWPNPRFTVNTLSDGVTSNGTVTDNLTGLIWLMNASCLGGTWQQVLNSANSLAAPACGLSDGSVAGDWRLPNISELESLVDTERSTYPSLTPGHPFTGYISRTYWSSSTVAFNTGMGVNGSGSAWWVNMGDGSVSNYYGKTYIFTGWPVRGGK